MNAQDSLGSLTKIKFIGNGKFSEVYLANSKFGKLVVKETTLSHDYIGFQNEFIKEVDMLIKFKQIPFVLDLLGVNYNVNTRKAEMFLECMDSDLNQWYNYRPMFLDRIKELPNLIFSIGKTIAVINKNGFCHNDIKDNNILVKIQNGSVIFKLSDFGKSIFVDNYYKNYGGVDDYTSPWHRNILSNECWAFAVCCTELILGKRMFHSNNRNSIINSYLTAPYCFDIYSFLRDNLPNPSLVDKIPDIYWNCFKHIFNNNLDNANMEYCLNSIGVTINDTIANVVRDQLIIVNHDINIGSHNDSINHYIEKISKKFYDNYNLKNLYCKLYSNLMKYFFTQLDHNTKQQLFSILSPIDGIYYSEVGYITLLGKKAEYLERFQMDENGNKLFHVWQNAFLQRVDHQIIIF